MKREKLLACVAFFSLVIGGLSIVCLSNNRLGQLVKTVADGEAGKITFQNNGSNVSEVFEVEEDDVNFYTNTVGGRLYGGTPLYMRVSHSKTIGDAADRMAVLFNSTVSFRNGEGDEYKFQNLSSIEIHMDDCARDVTVWTSHDGVAFTPSYQNTDDDGYGNFSITNSRYVRFSVGGSMDMPLFRVTLNYSCSYDYVEPELKTVTIYASNDFHGKVPQSGNEVGLEKYATYFKDKSDDENTLLIDSGDSWQGSAYSNLNYGNLVNDVMIEAGWDVRTIGNHDFDWGVDRLKANTARTYKGQTLKTLAANVYDFDFSTKQYGSTQQSDIGDKTATFILENGLKVGVVGVIGYSQITSINSLYTHDIGFKDHVQTIKDEATRLRNDEGCNVVIASCHTGQEEVMGRNLGDYVDLVLCAHTHRFETANEGNLYFAQFGSNGLGAGKITLSYDPSSNDVISTGIETIYSASIDAAVTTVDPTIHQLVSDANTVSDTIANEVVANNVTGSFYKAESLENLMVKAVYDSAVAEGYTDITCSYVNDARCNSIVATDNKWTFADIYEAFPFDNEVYIIEATGREMMNEVNKYNYCYFSQDFVNGGKTVKYGQKYKIAVLDYLAFHTSDSRYYNYFDDNDGHYLGTLSKNYRLLLKDWLNENGYNSGTALNPSSFTTADTRFYNKYQLTCTCDLKFMMNDGTDAVYEPVNNVASGQYISSFVPANDPTRSNYTFGGWYLNPACTDPIDNVRIYSDFTIYAKWISAGTYTTGDIDYGSFTEGETSTALTATNIGGEEKTITLAHDAMKILTDNLNYPYNNTCFTIPAQKSMTVTAPSGYKITQFVIRAYRTYDNFDFYANENKLEETVNTPSSAPYYIRYMVEPNSNQLRIDNSYTSGYMYCYELSVTIQPIE